jgi:hypothetical protein
VQKRDLFIFIFGNRGGYARIHAAGNETDGNFGFWILDFGFIHLKLNAVNICTPNIFVKL